MSTSYLYTDELADYLVNVLRSGSTAKQVVKTRADQLRDFPFAVPVHGTAVSADSLPSLYVVCLGPKVLPGKVIGPVVDVEENFRIVYLTAADNGEVASTSGEVATTFLNAEIESLSRLLMDHALLESGVLGEGTEQLRPALLSTAEYDPPELRPWKEANPSLTGFALSLSITTTTCTP